MKLIGQRIIIRDIKFSDDKDYLEYASNENVGPNAGWKPVKTLDLARKIIASHIISNETFAIALKENNKFIGSISLYNNPLRKYNLAKALGFSLNYYYWGQGIMTEAVKLFIDYVFTKTNCEILEVGHHLDNKRSKRVIQKCGFKLDGVFCKYKKLYDGRIVDAVFYSLSKEDYERMKKER